MMTAQGEAVSTQPAKGWGWGCVPVGLAGGRMMMGAQGEAVSTKCARGGGGVDQFQ